MNIRIKKSNFRMILLIVAVGIIGFLMLRGGGERKQENEIAITAVSYMGEDVTAKADIEKLTDVIGEAGITKSIKGYGGEACVWKIDFTLNGEAWTIVLGEEANLMFMTDGDCYKIKNAEELMTQLEACIG